MIILDTDCVSLLSREKILESSALRRKLEQFPPDELFTTIITFEEHKKFLHIKNFINSSKTIEMQMFWIMTKTPPKLTKTSNHRKFALAQWI
jgi:hypothetical protein